MATELLIERLFEALTDGDREVSGAIVRDHLAEAGPKGVLTGLLWPTAQLIDRLYRSDELSILRRNMAVKLLRVLADRCGERLGREEGANGKAVLAMCGEPETEELGAQIAVDVLHASGFDVRFAGGGVPNDEILAEIHARRPDVLLAFCSTASDLPALRGLIDTMHEIGACPEVQIVVGGGVFNRADGLAEEIGADLWAQDPVELVETLILDAEHRAPADQRTVGKVKRKLAA